MYSSDPKKRACTPFKWSHFHPACSYFGLNAYLFIWILKDFVKYSGLIWNFFGTNKVYFQKYFLLLIKLQVFTLYSSILIKIPPCTLLFGTASLSIFLDFCQIFFWKKLGIFSKIFLIINKIASFYPVPSILIKIPPCTLIWFLSKF